MGILNTIQFTDDILCGLQKCKPKTKTAIVQSSTWRQADNTVASKFMHAPIKDSFVRAIPQKKSVQAIDDKLEEFSINSDNFEVLALDLYRKIQKSGRGFVASEQFANVAKATGLSESQVATEFDNLASMIQLLKQPTIQLSDPYKFLDMRLGSKKVNISFLSAGMSGTAYKVEIPGIKPMILKKYHGTEHSLKGFEGAYPEIAIQKKMYESGVRDSAAMIAANPKNGWVLSEFVGPNYKLRKGKCSFEEFVAKNKLDMQDRNGGMCVAAADGERVLVDFGWIVPTSRRQNGVYGFKAEISELIKEEQAMLNFDKLLHQYNTNPSLRFSIISRIEKYGDKDFCSKFYEATKNTPQMKLYTDYAEFLAQKAFVNSQKTHSLSRLNPFGGTSLAGNKTSNYTPSVTENSLQDTFRKCGFEGDINDFINIQRDSNPYASNFRDFLTPMFDDLFSKF